MTASTVVPTVPKKWQKATNAMLTLHKALERDPPGTVIKTLLQAFPDAIFLKDSNGMLPIHHSAKSSKKCALGFAIIMQAFPAGTKVRDNEGRLPIHLACEYDAHEGVVDMLIDQYPQALYVEDENGCTALDFLKTQDAYEIKTPLKRDKSAKDAHLRDMEEISEQVLEVIPSDNASKRQMDILRRLAGKKDGRTRYSFTDRSHATKEKDDLSDTGSYSVFDISIGDFSRRLSWESSTLRSAIASIPEWSVTDGDNNKDGIRIDDETFTAMEDGPAKSFGTQPTPVGRNLQTGSKSWRSLVSGFEIGLSSSFVLIAGLCGCGQLTVGQIFVIGLASAWGAAISLAVNEFLSNKNIEFTNHHHHYGEESKEDQACNFTTLEDESDITRMLNVIGTTDENMRAQLRNQRSYNVLDSKHGQGPKHQQKDSALHDAFSSGATFITGSLLPILPFVFISTQTRGLIYSVVILCASVIICQFFVNYYSTPRENCVASIAAYAIILVAGIGGAVSYFVGIMLTNLLL